MTESQVKTGETALKVIFLPLIAFGAIVIIANLVELGKLLN